MILTGDFQDSRERFRVSIHPVPDLFCNLSGGLIRPNIERISQNGITHMLIDEKDCNVLSLPCISIKRLLDYRCLRLGVHDEEVFLCIWSWSYMLLIRHQ